MQIKNRKLKNNNKGITLIALVITIIVLLILAGLAIATLTGDNGILTKAASSKEKTDKASAEEAVKLEYLGSIDNTGKFNYEDFKTNVKNNLGLQDTDIIDNGDNTCTVKYNGYDVTLDIATGNIVVPPEPAKVGEIVTGSNKKYTEGGETATIPVGFGIVPDLDDISEGLVITDHFNETTGESDGNEFVWIPVPTAVSPSEAEGTTNKAMAVNLGTAENPQYRGLLYNFNDTGSTVISGCTNPTSTSYREPDIVSSYDNDTTTYLSGIGLTQASFQAEMQNSYNKMIKSVSKNHGFYVARYEMSLDESKNAQSKKNVTSADASQTDTKMWYGLYTKAKTYNKASVVSSMIWGSQYDAMMNWMHKDSNVNVNSTTPIAGATKNTTRTTGGANSGQTESKDIIKNVYDLLGNSWEWTLEAYDSSLRVNRGGSYNDSISPAYRYYICPYDTSSYGSSRLTLYIK